MPGTDFIKVTVDEAKLKAIEARVADIPYAMNRLVPRAMNRALTAKRDPQSTRNLAIRRISQALGISEKRISRRFFTNDASGLKWIADIKAGKRGFNLAADMGASDIYPRGVRVVSVMGRAQLYPRAFFIPGINNVFQRRALEGGRWTYRNASDTGALVRRLPIQTIVGPAAGDVFRDVPEVEAEIMADGKRRVETAIWIEAENEIAKKMPK